MNELIPLIPEKKILQLIKDRIEELNLSQRKIADELDIPQSLISRSLQGTRALRYDELQRIIEYLLSLESLIQIDMKALELAVPYKKIKWVNKKASISTVADIMVQGGFSQIPVKREDREDFIGVVTELGILKKMLHPNKAGLFSIGELREISVEAAGVLEPIADCPPDVPLNIVSQLLVYFPALLLKDDLGNVKGLITRADMLRLLSGKV